MTSHSSSTQPGVSHFISMITLICFAQVANSIDFSIVSIALPAIQRSLSLSAASVASVVSANALTCAGLMMFGGRLTDIHGARRCILIGLGLFGTGLCCSASATSLAALVSSRSLQGCGEALLMPAVSSLLNTAFPPGPLRVRAYAWSSGSQGISLIIGWALGGLVTAQWSWRFSILINLPLLIVTLILTLKYLPTPARPLEKRSVDLLGAVLVTLGTGAIVASLSMLSDGEVQLTHFVLPAAVGLILLATFAWWERRMPDPLLPLAIFAAPNVSAANIAIVASMGGACGLFLLPNLYMQNVLHFSAGQSGVGMIPFSLTVMATGPLMDWTLNRYSVRQNTLGGLAAFFFGLLLFAVVVNQSSYLWVVLPPLIICAAGSLLSSAALCAAGTVGVAEDRQGVAWALVITSQQLGLALSAPIVLAVVMSPAASQSAAALIQALRTALLSSAGFVACATLVILLFGARPDRRAPHVPADSRT